MISREKLHAWRNQLKAGELLGVTDKQAMQALIDSNLKAWDELEGGKSTQELRAELVWREQQLQLGLKDLRDALSRPGISVTRARLTVDMLHELVKAKGPRWFRDWKSYQERIAEEFDEPRE
jgi:hypothetical protein